jgi:GTP-binding protein HflX
VVKRFSQKMERPNPKTFVGTGKIEEIHLLLKKTKYQP